jgi:hypothetical protein
MPQVNLAGPAGQAAADGVAAAELGDVAGVGVGEEPDELALGEDSRLQPPSAAQATAAAQRRDTTFIAERSATPGSLRKVAGPAWRLGR